MKHVKLQMLVSGLLVIAAGALIVAFSAGLIPIEYKAIIFSWPMLLIAIGFSLFFGGFRKVFPATTLVLVGGIFLLRRMDIGTCYLTRENVWATILVVFGLLIVLKACFFRNFHGRFHNPEKMREWQEQYKNCHCNPHHHHHGRRHEYARPNFGPETRNGADYLERNCIFGACNELVGSQDFKGGEIACVFGSLKLDFTSAQLAEGENILEISTVFGGIELIVPADWKVELRQTSVFGGFADKRAKPAFEVADNRKLILVITSVFGGGEIKDHA